MEVLKKIKEKSDILICADGGAKHLYKAGLMPNVIVGDLDSIDKETLEYYNKLKVQFYKFPSEKDKTDTEIAIDYAIEKNVSEIILLGVTGTRLDHTIGNIMLLFRLLNQNIKARIVDEHNEIYITDGDLKLEKEDGVFVSIIPIYKDAKEVTLKGFKYETNKLEFKLGTTIGISNEIISEYGNINIKDGTCLVIKSRD